MSAPSCGAVPCGLECFSFYIDPLIDPIINTVGTSVFILKNLLGHYQTRYPHLKTLLLQKFGNWPSIMKIEVDEFQMEKLCFNACLVCLR